MATNLISSNKRSSIELQDIQRQSSPGIELTSRGRQNSAKVSRRTLIIQTLSGSTTKISQLKPLKMREAMVRTGKIILILKNNEESFWKDSLGTGVRTLIRSERKIKMRQTLKMWIGMQLTLMIQRGSRIKPISPLQRAKMEQTLSSPQVSVGRIWDKSSLRIKKKNRSQRK